MKKAGFLVFLFVIAIGSCFSAPLESERAESLSFGMVSYASPEKMEEALSPFLAVMEKNLDLKFLVRLYPDYQSILHDIDRETLDLAILSPIVFALTMDDPTLSFLGTVLRKERSVYHSVILTKPDSGIFFLEHLAGKRIGFVSKYSASGYIYPAAFFRSVGLIENGEPKYLPSFWESHEKVVRALLEGYVDAIATYEGIFDLLDYKVGNYDDVRLERFRVLKLLPDRIPEDALTCRSALGEKMVSKLLATLKGFQNSRKRDPKFSRNEMISGFKLGTKDAYKDVQSFLSDVMESK